MKFDELQLSEPLLHAVKSAGFEEATPIQAETIPLALEGKDVIGQAQTGTGKTAAFALPILEKLQPRVREVQALIISPTRELAIQTQEEINRLGKYKKTRSVVVYGGADIRRQIRLLKEHPAIVVGTPGRLLDHIQRKTLDLSHVHTLVLDEADEMLNMGFLEDIEKIIAQVPTERQTLLFSATMPAPIKKIGVHFMHSPDHVKIKAKEMTASNIEQYYVRAKEYEKFDFMTRLFDVQTPELAIVFGRTKRRVDELARGLELRGYKAEGIHGDLSQQKRMSVLRMFKSGKLDILVATDVAARGLDISGVTHVYNYDIPQDPESYVHRVGRTGRAGKAGVSVTFVTPNEMNYLHVIEDLTKKRMLPLHPPTEKEAMKGQIEQSVNDISKQIDKKDLEDFYPAANELLESYEDTDLVALLIKTLSKEEVQVKITPERPLPGKKKRFNKKGSDNRRRGNSRKDSNFYKNERYGRDKNKNRRGKNDDSRHNSSAKKSHAKATGFTIRSRKG